MKIKTITCHDVYNHGASLQAFALINYLEKLGHEVEIIDYKPYYMNLRFNLCALDSKWRNKSSIIKLLYLIYKLPRRYFSREGKKEFDIFKHKFLKISNKRYTSNLDLKMNPPLADAFIAGSDQIWNTLYENGKDPAFYLDFVPQGKRRISYAASFATDDIASECSEFVESMVKSIDYVSVRESKGIEILNKLNICNAYHVLDPVFLLKAEDWDNLIVEKFDEEYVLVYDFDHNDKLEDFVKNMANDNGLKIYSVNNYSKSFYADKDFYSCGPQTFLALIKNAKFIVSNSFHATVFSVIFNKVFFVFDRIKQKNNSRMHDLLLNFNLLDRFIGCNESSEVKNTSIDYSKVNREIERYINKSKDFLNVALKLNNDLI